MAIILMRLEKEVLFVAMLHLFFDVIVGCISFTLASGSRHRSGDFLLCTIYKTLIAG
jgi:hypothetical protein